MITVEELLARAKKEQEKFNKSFWWYLLLEIESIHYYGGGHVLFDNKIYEIRTREDVVVLFLKIYDAYKNQYE